MKRLLIAAALPLVFFSCAKEEVTNPAFREPTCSDTTDEGIFEHFTQPEAAEFLRWFRFVPDTGFSPMFYQNINDRILYNRATTSYSPYIKFMPMLRGKMFVYMPFPNQPEKYYSWVETTTDTTVETRINIYHLRELNPQLQSGCYRLYYVYATTDSGFVLDKGHYDIEVKN